MSNIVAVCHLSVISLFTCLQKCIHYLSRIRKPTLAITVLTVLLMVACGEETENAEGNSLTTNSTHVPNLADSMVRYPESWPDTFGFGRLVSAAEISEWDIDVMPDGTGLPAGSGTVAEGSKVYRNKCITCHGVTGVEGPFDKLVGREPRNGFPFGQDYKYSSMRTIGNYWPYATTLFDYIRRAMPQTEPGSLTANEVYALSAYLLHLNEIIPADAVLDMKTLPEIKMPAKDRFVIDNRSGGKEIR